MCTAFVLKVVVHWVHIPGATTIRNKAGVTTAEALSNSLMATALDAASTTKRYDCLIGMQQVKQLQ